ncbi:MAG: hypothetical protein E6Q59_10920 [Nitrosomonas sp.]|nr:MAG: hypothetical protein E6Q59_10920 [Nitrosomonas sp.]
MAAKVFGTPLPIITNSLGGSLKISDTDGRLSIRGLTRYQGKVIGFVNNIHPKSTSPIDYHHQQQQSW